LISVFFLYSVGQFSEWDKPCAAAVDTCKTGQQTRVFSITTSAVGPSAQCAHEHDSVETRPCNADPECPEEAAVETVISKTEEPFTEDEQESFINALAAELGIDADLISIEIGEVRNPTSRRLTEGLLITVTIAGVTPAKAVEEIEKLESPAFVEKIAEETGVTVEFKQFKPAHGSLLCATCKWDEVSGRIQTTHYINSQTHGTKGMQHRCYHYDGKCKCECNKDDARVTSIGEGADIFDEWTDNGAAKDGRITPNGPAYGTPGLNWDGN
jgi:hypothetical protein